MKKYSLKEGASKRILLVYCFLITFHTLNSLSVGSNENIIVKNIAVQKQGNILHVILSLKNTLQVKRIRKITYESEHVDESHDVLIPLPPGYSVDERQNISGTKFRVEWFRGTRFVRLQLNTSENETLHDTLDLRLRLIPKGDTNNFRQQLDDPYLREVTNNITSTSLSSNMYFTELEWIDTTDRWIEYDKEYLKIGITNDGIYRITRNDLVQFVRNVNTIDPRTFRLYNKGKEIEIFVFGENDGVFDEGDYIEFPAFKNYGNLDYRTIPDVTSEYPQYMNRYTDTSYYWLTWNGRVGKRVLVNKEVPMSLDTVMWYPELIHIEEDQWLLHIGNDNIQNQYPYWQLNDMWCWGFLGAGGTLTINAFVTDVHYGINGKVYARLANYGASSANPHQITLRVNTSPVLDSSFVERFRHVLLTGAVPFEQLREGYNSIVLQSTGLTSGWNTMVYDWFELEYPRKLIAKNDSLIVNFRWNSIPKHVTIPLGGFSTSNIQIYKCGAEITKITKFTTVLNKDSYLVIFSDTVRPAEKYIAIGESKIQSPLFYGLRRFRNLRGNTQGADYILITAAPFLPIATEYCSFIQKEKGFRVLVVDVQDIFNEYGYGYPTPESIRDFLKSTTRWLLPMPSYVFLVGDGTYDFKYVLAGKNKSTWPQNYLPPYGYPVSDVLYTVFNEAGPIPQMYIGRLPVQTVEEFKRYFEWHMNYVSQGADIWNKTFIMFTGGDPNKPSEIEIFKQVNHTIIQKYIEGPPLGGRAYHFYKTISPSSNIGPYTVQEYQSILDSGAIVVNYIGHSGTQTWDNGITIISQLRNAKSRLPLIADFGCSTAKFAESNIRCFGELFVTQQDAPAIGYIGNTSLGFVSHAQGMPLKFFETIIVDSVRTLGKAHLLAKLKRINEVGGIQSKLNQILLYNNTLLGDPTVELALPCKPNFKVRAEDITTQPQIPNDQVSNLVIKVPYINTGIVVNDSLLIQFLHQYNKERRDTMFYRQCPLLYDTVYIEIPIQNKAGEHKITININPSATLDEQSFHDNTATKTVAVLSNAFRLLNIPPPYKRLTNTLVFLNPTSLSSERGKVLLQVDTTNDFQTPINLETSVGFLTTKFTIPTILPRKQYYWRIRLLNENESWSVGTFKTGVDTVLRWDMSSIESKDFAKVIQTKYFQNVGFRLDSLYKTIKIVAASFYEGSYGSVRFDGIEVLPNTFWWGHSVIILDTNSIEPKIVEQFKISEATGSEANRLATFLESLPYGTHVIHIVSTDGAQGLTQRIVRAIKEFGSVYIDSLQYRDSWIMLAKKGLPLGQAREIWHRGLPNVNNPSVLDTIMYKKVLYGEIETHDIGPVGKWKEFTAIRKVPEYCALPIQLLGKNTIGSYDTLILDNSRTDTIFHSVISTTHYKYLKVCAKFNADSLGVSPVLNNVSISLELPPELAINQKTVVINNDSLLEGSIAELKVRVFNLGESTADSFRIVATSVSSRATKVIGSITVPKLKPDSSYQVTFTFNTTGMHGNSLIIVAVDPENYIDELYRGNNIYTKSFFVQRDTVAPIFDITFDGKKILNGDYVLAKPTIQITIRDNSPLHITDPQMVSLKIDGRPVLISTYADSMFIPQTHDENAKVIYRPSLSKGYHTLEVRVRDGSGNWSDSAYTKIDFRVDTVTTLYHVYSYPNPFSKETYFTFVLAGTFIPEQVTIKIYTLYGRLIKTIDVIQNQLNAGFNRVYWDGRDNEGDEIANGIYLYKVSVKSNNTTVESIQKLAKVK